MTVDYSTIQITYGGYVVGGQTGDPLASAPAQLDGMYQLSIGPERGAISFRASLGADTAANMATYVSAFETAFRNVRTSILVTAKSQTFFTGSHSGNTAYDSEAEATLVEDEGLHRVYDVRISFGLPANYASLNGRRRTDIAVSFTPNRRETITVSGVYTAVSGSSASERYVSAARTYADAVVAALSSEDFDLIGEDYSYMETDKELRFTLRYLERYLDLAANGIIRQDVNIQVIEDAQGVTSTQPRKPTRFIITYRGELDRATIEGSAAMASLWTNTLRDWLIDRVEDVTAETLYIVDGGPAYNVTENTINATLTMSAPPRQSPVSIVYGSLTINGGGSYNVDTLYGVTREAEFIRIAARVCVSSATAAGCVTASKTLEEGIRSIRQDVSVTVNGTVLFTSTQAAATGYNSTASATLVEDRGTARYYQVEIVVQLPADYNSLAGRRTSGISVGLDASRILNVTITGTYTGVSGSASAVGKYEGVADTYCSGLLTALYPAVTFVLVDERHERHETDKELTFTRLYRQLLLAFPIADRMRDHVLRLTREEEFPIQSSTTVADSTLRTRKLIQYRLDYTATMDAEQITGTTDIDALYSGTILPWLKEQVALLVTDSHVIDTSHTYDPASSVLRASLTFFEVNNGNGPMDWTKTVTTTINHGYVFEPLDTENPLDRYVYEGPATVRVTIAESGIFIGAAPAMPTVAQVKSHVPSRVKVRGQSRTPRWALNDESSSIQPQYIGDPDDVPVSAYTVDRSWMWEAYEIPQTDSSGAAPAPESLEDAGGNEGNSNQTADPEAAAVQASNQGTP